MLLVTKIYFLKTKYTARIKNTKATAWFQRKVSVLKNTNAKRVNTVKDITSCITFSWNNEKGPPFPLKPILFAGIWHMYSKRATPQLKSITIIKGIASNHLNPLSLKCPYQANVINMFEVINKSMVDNPFIILPV